MCAEQDIPPFPGLAPTRILLRPHVLEEPVISIPLEDMVFVICLLIGGGLLLITVLVDDVIGGLLDHFDIGIGGASLMPLLLSFVSMFGVGGLFATQVLGLHGAAAATVGVIFGIGGALLAFTIFGFMKRSEGEEPFSTEDLVGHDAFVAVTIPASRWGSVYVKAEGQNHELTATASEEIAAGTAVRITGTAGSGLVVARATPVTSDSPPPPATPAPAGPSADVATPPSPPGPA
jgi:membrane protein implicated in regulation of membrane protease activity